MTQELAKIARNLDRKLNELQKSVIEMRMVPVGQIYSKLSRTVRKVARELNKEIELVLRGEETELDKMMVEELTDPLMHIIRNALDHGIESAEERARAGKPAIGRVTLTAYQQGNSVVIDVRDDGRGIDPERIRAVAIERGLVGEGETIDEQRAYELMFTPGFSTASAVSEISGRGVGLDVVKRNIQELKGTIDDHLRAGQRDDVPDHAADHAGDHSGAHRPRRRREVRDSSDVGRGVAAHLLARHPHPGAPRSVHAARLRAPAAAPVGRIQSAGPRRRRSQMVRGRHPRGRQVDRHPSSTRWCGSRRSSSSRSASG